eukprot:512572_1
MDMADSDSYGSSSSEGIPTLKLINKTIQQRDIEQDEYEYHVETAPKVNKKKKHPNRKLHLYIQTTKMLQQPVKTTDLSINNQNVDDMFKFRAIMKDSSCCCFDAVCCCNLWRSVHIWLFLLICNHLFILVLLYILRFDANATFVLVTTVWSALNLGINFVCLYGVYYCDSMVVLIRTVWIQTLFLGFDCCCGVVQILRTVIIVYYYSIYMNTSLGYNSSADEYLILLIIIQGIIFFVKIWAVTDFWRVYKWAVYYMKKY